MELLHTAVAVSSLTTYDGVMDLDDYYDDIERMAGEGISDARIAAALPIVATGQQVYRFRYANGIEKVKARWASKLDPYADDIRRMYVEERRTDQYIADHLPVQATDERVRAYRTKTLGVQSDRTGRSSERYITADRYDQIKDELPEVWEKSKQWHQKQNRMVPSSERVAERYGVSFSTAQRWLRRAGLLTDRPSIKREGQRAKELFDQGWSVPRIAAELGQKDDSVRNWLNAQGCDLSNHVARMSHEEKLAWRGSISDAKAQDEDTTRRHPYGEHMLGSKYEVIAATQFDRVGLPWRPYSRLQDGVLDYEKTDGHVSRYAPDLVVTFNGADINIEIKGLYATLDQLKVRRWREEKGRLSLMLRPDILELEHASTAQEAFDSVRACLYNDPEPKVAEWRA